MSRNRRLRIRRLFALGISAVLAAAAVRSADAEGLKTWRNGIVAAKGDAGFVFMAARHGFAEEEGIKLDIAQFKGDAIALKGLIAGELDSYDGSPGGPMMAVLHGADVKIVGCYWPGVTYGLFSKESVTGPQDMKGKVFAISGPGALPDLLARAILDKYGIPASDVRFAVMGSDSDRFQALLAGVVDIAAASIEFVPEAKARHIRLLVNAREAVPNYLRFCTYMSSKTIATRREEAVHYLAAQMKTLRYALAHRDEEIALTRQIIDAEPDDPRPAYIFDEVQKSSAIDPTMAIPMDQLQWMQQLLVATGNLSDPIDLSKMVDGSLREEALRLAAQ